MKYLFYVIGILILTLGIAFTIQSDLGASPFDALLVGLAVHAGLTVGSWEVIIALLLIGCNSFLKRQRPEVSGLLTAFITGIGIDMWLFCCIFCDTRTMVQQSGLFWDRLGCYRIRNRDILIHKFCFDAN